MIEIFSRVLAMSLGASYVVLVVLVLRLIMKRLPKIFSYWLWLAVALRLILPFDLQSNISLQGFLTGVFRLFFRASVEPIEGSYIQPSSMNGTVAVRTLRQILDANASPMNSVDPSQVWLWAFGWVWVIGVFTLLLLGLTAYVRTCRLVAEATCTEGPIFESEHVVTPFVCGFLKPKIYLPLNLENAMLEYIVLHEETHIERRDYLVKAIAYGIAVLHWFNPLAWLAFALMTKDMEMACDERVIRRMGSGIRKDYATSLLSLAVHHNRRLTPGPLAFGESHVKSRIKNVLTYKKTTFWVLVVALVVTVVLVVALVASPRSVPGIISPDQAMKTYSYEMLVKNRTAYIGNNSKVIALADQMLYPEGAARGSVALKTSKQPYGVTIKVLMKPEALTQFVDKDRQMMKNSLLLLALIDNADYAEFIGVTSEDDHQPSGTVHVLSRVERAEAEKSLGVKLRSFGHDAAGLDELISKVNAIH